MTFRRLFARERVLGTLVVVAASMACIRLGIWQLDRLGQQRAFNHYVAAAREMPPLGLPWDGDLAGQEYRAVRVVGAYDFEKQVAVRNQFYGGQPGFHLITPLLVGSGDSVNRSEPEAVLIDRGWIPATDNEKSSDWRKYDEPGSVAVTGVVRLGGPAPSLAGLAEPTPIAEQGAADFWTSIDINRIERQIGYSLLPVYVEKSPATASERLPIATVPVLDLTEGPHLGYAIQWFGFATLLMVGYPLYLGKREARRT